MLIVLQLLHIIVLILQYYFTKFRIKYLQNVSTGTTMPVLYLLFFKMLGQNAGTDAVLTPVMSAGTICVILNLIVFLSRLLSKLNDRQYE
mgnify:CR=1 FL=1